MAAGRGDVGRQNSEPGSPSITTRLDRAWLITWKKGDPDRHVSYEELVRQLLCFGWIDSTARRVDEERSGLLIARRRPKSGWSRPNKIRVAELIEAGLMQPAGQAAIDQAKESGAWTALDDIENLVEPADLCARPGREPGGATALGRVSALGQAQHPGLGRRCQAESRPGPNGSSRPSNWPPTTSARTSLILGVPRADRAVHPVFLPRSPTEKRVGSLGRPDRVARSTDARHTAVATDPRFTEPRLG